MSKWGKKPLSAYVFVSGSKYLFEFTCSNEGVVTWESKTSPRELSRREIIQALIVRSRDLKQNAARIDKLLYALVEQDETT